MVECLAHGQTEGKWWSQVLTPSAELQLALQRSPRDRWDFKRPRWEVDILGRGNSRSQAWVKSPVQSGRQCSRARTRRDALQVELWEERKRLWKPKQNES